jgi:Asparagine synthase
MERHLVSEYTFPWGIVIAQHAQGGRFAPGQFGERLIIPIGRPTICGQELKDATDAFAQWVDAHESEGLAEKGSEITPKLSGMYVVFEFSQEQVVVLTDHMGFRPVYIARDEDGQVLGFGTHVESLAAATGQRGRIDLVSLGELFTYNHITFPFTTRKHIQELNPCAITVYRPDARELSSTVIWEPKEPEVFPDKAEIRSLLKDAVLQAGNDLTRGCERVAVLLSGGYDSRVVLGAMPKSINTTAITYVTRENRETDVAGLVARAGGAEQLLVQRDEDYFPMLVCRGLGLIGMELRANCHGLCIADNDLADSFDVVIGGQLSDTLLKDHFMPLPKRERFRSRPLKSKLKERLTGASYTPVASTSHTTGRGALVEELVPEIREQVRDRRAARMREVERVRPTTADEWHRFWPCSRQDDSSHTLGNTRLMCSDTLFAHQAIVEVSRVFAPRFRVDGLLTDEVFAEICGPLAEIINANTGLPANASQKQIKAKQKKDRIERNRQESTSDWNAVETSWINPVIMQQNSKIWGQYREQLADSQAIEILSQVIARGGQEMIQRYQTDLPSASNHIAIQLALWLDQVIDQSTLTHEVGS